MKKLVSIFILFYFVGRIYSVDYVVKSPNINNPDINIEYVRNNVQFWIDYAYDPNYGGFYSSINRDGSLQSTTKKSLISQTRQGYGFTRAFMLTGDETYLTYAKSALDFLTTYGWDTTNDGWYCFAKADGSLDNRTGWNPNSGKWGFQQHYALLGLIANYEATHDANIKSWMDKGINSINTHMWDSRVGKEGYYEQGTANWGTMTGKGFTTTVDAITTNAELSYLVTQDADKKNRLLQLGDIIVNRFIPLMDDSRVKVLYPESYSTDWQVSSYTSDESVGHFIKTSWVLGRAYLCDTTKKEFKNAAIKILDETWTYDNGSGVTIWDHVNGGPFNSLNKGTGGWGNNGNIKDYWTLEQGFTGPMINYYITKNPVYLQMADESISFYMDYFIDKTYGETFSTLNKDGSTIVNSTKGDDFKGNYHAVEFGYYAYLYSNLYYLHQPASLYYKFNALPTAQTIKLSPIPMEEGLLRIKSVTLNGNDFTNFDAATRTLNIAANEGGKFKVTFESLLAPTSVPQLENGNISIYPNPTHQYIKVDQMENISNISLVDLTGKVLIKQDVTNQSSIKLDIQHQKSGVYLIVLQQNNGLKLTRKVVKL